MATSAIAPNFAEYRTVGQAAAILGVSAATLRNWDKSGKLKSRRHPQNGYRIYLHEDLEAVLRSVDISTLTDGSFVPQFEWAELTESDHFVQFYEDDNCLVDAVSGFVGTALAEGGSSIVIATAEHRQALNQKLTACGIKTQAAIADGRFELLDASETLGLFMVDAAPDRRLFLETVGAVLKRISQRGGKIHAFGEMVALLWAEGKREAAIRLEELWNELAKQYCFALYCAYPLAGFSDQQDGLPLANICHCHSKVIPAESYNQIATRDERLEAIALLQQKAQSLEAEIQHRRAVEAALLKRERELADFFEEATEGLHKVGADGTILWANKTECDLVGYSMDEYVGRSITDFHADADVIQDILEKLQRGESLENYPARLKCKDGSIRHVLINSNACFEDGQFAYTRCFTRDITQQWHAENALREADRRKDEFLATLAHELRNPLAPIKNALGVLAAAGADNPTVEETRLIMERQVRQLARLVDDLLDVSRIASGKIELRKERVELAAVVERAVETSRPLIDAAGHKLTITFPHEPLLVVADSTRLEQVFANLLNNAAKYTEHGGRIELQVERDEDQVAIKIRDNGVGISGADLAHVFDMFRQVDGSLKRSQGGLGIGLTLVRRLVELHGGTVRAQSDGVGKGSEFIVRLPLAAIKPAASRLPTATTKIPLIKRRILVVDDNADASDTLGRLLQLKGHDVQTAHDGLEAIDAAVSFQPEVILMDVGMPKLNGYDATRRIRETPPGKDMVIFALTGWGQADDIQKAKQAGCTGHLVKPVDFTVLDQLLSDLQALAPQLPTANR